MLIGRALVTPILDASVRELTGNAVSHPDGAPWSCHHQPADAQGRIQIDIGSFLIRTDDRTMLIDAGMGTYPYEYEQIAPGAPSMLENLRRAGVDPADVTDVFFTHLHFDHVGWATTGGEVTFPNATFHVHNADWHRYMVDPIPVPVIQEWLAPIESRVQVFDTETELVPGIIARPAPGHTPGSTIYLLQNDGHRALFLGDVAHTVAELTEPVWVGAWDLDPVAAGAVRDRIARELADNGDLFAPAHLPGLGFGRLMTADGLRRFSWA